MLNKSTRYCCPLFVDAPGIDMRPNLSQFFLLIASPQRQMEKDSVSYLDHLIFCNIISRALMAPFRKGDLFLIFLIHSIVINLAEGLYGRALKEVGSTHRSQKCLYQRPRLRFCHTSWPTLVNKNFCHKKKKNEKGKTWENLFAPLTGLKNLSGLLLTLTLQPK